MRCPRCGVNYVVEGYCRQCLSELRGQPEAVLPPERAPRQCQPRWRSALDRLSGRLTFPLLLAASLLPGLGLLLTGHRKRGLGIFAAALLLVVAAILAVDSPLFFLCLAAAFALASWSAMRTLAPRVTLANARAAAFFSLNLSLALLAGYFCLWQCFLLCFALQRVGPGIEMNSPYRNGDYLLVARQGTPATGDWVLADLPGWVMMMDFQGRLTTARQPALAQVIVPTAGLTDGTLCFDDRFSPPRLVTAAELTVTSPEEILLRQPAVSVGRATAPERRILTLRSRLIGRIILPRRGK